MLFAVKAPAGATLQLPNPYTEDASTPHYRMLIKAESEYSAQVEVFVLSADSSGNITDFKKANGEEQNTALPTTRQSSTKQISNDQVSSAAMEKNESYRHTTQCTSVKVSVHDLYLKP